jgi:hypothetical protein
LLVVVNILQIVNVILPYFWCLRTEKLHVEHCLSLRNNSRTAEWILVKFDIAEVLLKHVNTIQFWLKSDSYNREICMKIYMGFELIATVGIYQNKTS